MKNTWKVKISTKLPGQPVFLHCDLWRILGSANTGCPTCGLPKPKYVKDFYREYYDKN